MESSASKEESKEKIEQEIEVRTLKNVKLEQHYLNGPLNESDESFKYLIANKLQDFEELIKLSNFEN
jgi:hypothetical protein